MQNTNTPHTDAQHPAPPQDNFVRIFGRYIGRALTTVAAAIAMRLWRTHYATDNDKPAEPITPTRILEEVKQDASIAAAAVLAWNTQFGGATGADAVEYVVDRGVNFVTHTIPETPLFPRSTIAIVDRVADNMLSRFANYMTRTIPEVQSALQGPAPRYEGMRFHF